MKSLDCLLSLERWLGETRDPSKELFFTLATATVWGTHIFHIFDTDSFEFEGRLLAAKDILLDSDHRIMLLSVAGLAAGYLLSNMHNLWTKSAKFLDLLLPTIDLAFTVYMFVYLQSLDRRCDANPMVTCMMDDLKIEAHTYIGRRTLAKLIIDICTYIGIGVAHSRKLASCHSCLSAHRLLISLHMYLVSVFIDRGPFAPIDDYLETRNRYDSVLVYFVPWIYVCFMAAKTLLHLSIAVIYRRLRWICLSFSLSSIAAATLAVHLIIYVQAMGSIDFKFISVMKVTSLIVATAALPHHCITVLCKLRKREVYRSDVMQPTVAYFK